ncbi:MAG: hypothetical protein ACPGPS_14810 [Rubripirellula sp.]
MRIHAVPPVYRIVLFWSACSRGFYQLLFVLAVYLSYPLTL